MARSEGPKAGHGLPDRSKGNGNDSVKGAKSSMVVLGKILIMDLELRTEVLRDASRELETLRMASVKQELAMLDRPGLIERMTGAKQVVITDELLLETGQSASPRNMPTSTLPKADWF